MKKIFLNLGTIGLITAPAVTLISCSDETKTTTDDTQTGTPSTSKGNTDLSLSQKKLELANISIPVKETLQEGATLLQSLIGQYDEAKKELATLKTQGAATNNLTEINSIIINANAAKDRAIAYNTKVTEANNALAAIKRTTLNSIKLPPKTQLLDGATLPTDIVTYDTAQTNLRDAQAVTGNDISALNAAIAKAEQAKRDATAYNAKVIDVNNNLASSKRTELTNISLPAKVALLDGATLPTDIVTYETAQSNLRDAQAVRGNDISALNAAIAKAKQAVTDATTYNAKVTELNRGISAINSKKAELLALSLPEKKVLLNPSSATTLTDITTYEQASTHLITAKEKSQSNDMSEIEAGITAAKAAIEEAKAYNTKVDVENNKAINAKKAELQAIVLEAKVPLNSGVSIPANSGIVTYEQAAQTLTSAKTKASLPSISYQQLLDAIKAANQARTQAIAYNVKVNELNGDKAATLAAKKRQLANISLPPKVTLLATLHLSISQTYEHAQQTLNAAKSTTGDLDAINAAITNASAAIEEANIYNAAALKANNDLITNKKAELNSKSLPVKTNLLSGVNKPAGIISYEIAKTAFTAAKAKASLPSVSYQQLLDAISEANKAIADANTYNTKVTEANKKFIDSKKAELATITLPAKVELITGATLPTNVVTYETAQTHLAEAKKVTSNDLTLLNAAITKAKQAKSDAVTYNTQATKVNNLLITSKRTELTQITLPTKVTLLDGATAPSGVTSYEESQTAFNRAKEKLSLASPTIEVLTKAITDAKAAKAKVEAYNSAVQLANIAKIKARLHELVFPKKSTIIIPGTTPPIDTYTPAKTKFDHLVATVSTDFDVIQSALAEAENAIDVALQYNTNILNLNRNNTPISKKLFNISYSVWFDVKATLEYIAKTNGNRFTQFNGALVNIRNNVSSLNEMDFDNLIFKSINSDATSIIEFTYVGNNTKEMGSNISIKNGSIIRFEISNESPTIANFHASNFGYKQYRNNQVLKTKVFVNNKLISSDAPYLKSAKAELSSFDLSAQVFDTLMAANKGWTKIVAQEVANLFLLPDAIHSTNKSKTNATNLLNRNEVLELLNELKDLTLVTDTGNDSTHYLFFSGPTTRKYLSNNSDGPHILEKNDIATITGISDSKVLDSISFILIADDSNKVPLAGALDSNDNTFKANLLFDSSTYSKLHSKTTVSIGDETTLVDKYRNTLVLLELNTIDDFIALKRLGLRFFSEDHILYNALRYIEFFGGIEKYGADIYRFSSPKINDLETDNNGLVIPVNNHLSVNRNTGDINWDEYCDLFRQVKNSLIYLGKKNGNSKIDFKIGADPKESNIFRFPLDILSIKILKVQTNNSFVFELKYIGVDKKELGHNIVIKHNDIIKFEISNEIISASNFNLSNHPDPLAKATDFLRAKIYVKNVLVSDNIPFSKKSTSFAKIVYAFSKVDDLDFDKMLNISREFWRRTIHAIGKSGTNANNILTNDEKFDLINNEISKLTFMKSQIIQNNEVFIFSGPTTGKYLSATTQDESKEYLTESILKTSLGLDDSKIGKISYIIVLNSSTGTRYGARFDSSTNKVNINFLING